MKMRVSPISYASSIAAVIFLTIIFFLSSLSPGGASIVTTGMFELPSFPFRFVTLLKERVACGQTERYSLAWIALQAHVRIRSLACVNQVQMKISRRLLTIRSACASIVPTGTKRPHMRLKSAKGGDTKAKIIRVAADLFHN